MVVVVVMVILVVMVVLFCDRVEVDSRGLFKRENESSTEESVQSVD